MKISERKKKEGNQCCAYRCTNDPISRKAGLCHKHYARRLKERDPVYARYNQFCSKATKRGIENTITLEQFRDFCQRTGYIITKGYRGQNATLDRIRNSEGYNIDNIQLLTNRANASKGNRDENGEVDEYCPF